MSRYATENEIREVEKMVLAQRIRDLEWWHKIYDRALEYTGDAARAVRAADRKVYDVR